MAAPTQNLWRLPGGLRLPGNKTQATAGGIQVLPPPERLIIPLVQHAGDAAEAVVRAGDRVGRGQLVGAAAGRVSAAVHASTSGTVTAIEEHAIPAREPQRVPCILLESDGEDRPADEYEPVRDWTDLSPATLLEHIQRGGIAGLGGAAYPTAPKMAEGIAAELDGLILNGVECEPYISCDDMLMRERADELVEGARIMLHALELEHCLLAVESDKPEAWEALRAAVERTPDAGVELVQIPTIYPSGGEDQLVKLLTGREVPTRGLPSDAGYLVHNVGTAVAIARLVDAGEPLTSRIVTVTGEGIARPGNYEVRLGTPIADVAAAAGGYTGRAERLIMGGPMTGIALTTDELPVIKSTNCLLVTGPAALRNREPRRPCIRCGECHRVCPVRLQPHALEWEARRGDEAALAELGLHDCIECGCCDLVCPSHIPLTQIFRDAKHAVRLREFERQRAERAKRRFEAREAREAERRREESERIAAAKAGAGPDAIAAILARSAGRPSDDDGGPHEREQDDGPQQDRAGVDPAGDDGAGGDRANVERPNDDGPIDDAAHDEDERR